MSYCNAGDKPVIKYRFNNGAYKYFKSQYAPIEVESKTIPAEGTANYNREGYGISINAVNGSFNSAIVDYKDFRTGAFSGFPAGGRFIAVMSCGSTTFTKVTSCTSEAQKALDCLLNVYSLNPGSYAINPLIKCPSPNPEKCSIVVTYNNLTIFKDQGDCPLEFEVKCGNCPEGQEEHKISVYPGYCCMDCASIKQEIISIRNTVRNIRNG